MLNLVHTYYYLYVVMVNVQSTSVVHCGVDPQANQTKNYSLY